MLRICLCWVWLVAWGLGVHAQHSTNTVAFGEAAVSARKFQLLPGLKLDVWAAEPQLSNSVAFCFDGRGRVFLAESDRWAISVFDITAHTNWLLQDMSFRSVADRAAFLTHEFATNLTLLTKDSEAVRMLEDRDGAGRADHSQVVATGFNSVVDGTAAGVLAAGDGLYFANIPSLWRMPLPPPLPAENVKLKAENLASGFGVHIGVSGHDLHGLIQGPDGRIYMSFGDRGCVLTNREGVLIHLPDTGGVLRCEPDGRNLEVFCYGLRNPQELAFDDLGNLWTVDNDTAGADPCRVLHLVEGGDYGWRTSYQHMEGFGPWVQEELWKGGQDGILPPAGTVSQGPSGLAFYPGTGFGDRLKGTFLHADFPGGVWAFTVKPQGASFAVDHKEKFLWNCWPTDVDFGPDGGAYVLDWVSGWGQTSRGRIYRISPAAPLEPAELARVAEVKRFLAEGMTQRDEKELLDLLGHADRRVRLEAQWELAGRGTNSLEGLAQRLTERNPQLVRLHSVWAISQIARHAPVSDLVEELHAMLPLVQDKDPEIVRAAIQMFADSQLLNLELDLAAVPTDGQPRLQSAVCLGWAKLDLFHPARARMKEGLVSKAIRALPLDFIQATRLRVAVAKLTGEDVLANKRSLIDRLAAAGPFERQAAITLLSARPSKLKSAGTLFGGRQLDYAATNRDPSVRLLAVESLRLIATRRFILPNDYPVLQRPDPRSLVSPFVTNFLSDPDPKLIVAAGRAIHDVPIVEGFPALASFITKIDCPTNLYSRVIDACYRLGTQQHAQMLAGFAGREDVPDWARVLAMRALGDWEKPSPLDRVNGLWRPLVVSESASAASDATPPRSGLPPGLLERAAQIQSARNLGRASEVPTLPADLGRSVPFDEAMALRRNPASAQRAFLRVAGDIMNPFNLNEAGQPAGTREVLSLQIATVEATAKLRVKEAGNPLYEKFSHPNTPPELRQAAVVALAMLNSPLAGEAVKAALSDSDSRVRAAAIPFVDRLDGDDASQVLAALIPGKPDDWRLAQVALAQLGRRAVTDGQAAAALGRIADGAAREGFPPQLMLDLNEARRRPLEQAADGRTHPLEVYSLCLTGGDSVRGRDVFFNNPTVQCLRCHKVSGEGGTVGPDLTGIGGRQDRQYLLESLVMPNARMAPGFESVVLSLKDGSSLAGTLKRESDDALELDVVDPDTGETHLKTLLKASVVSRERGVSAMPDGLVAQLSPFEVRDLVEYLAGLK